MRWTRQRWACDGVAGRIALRERNPARKTTALYPPSLRLRRDWYQARRAAVAKGGPRTVKRSSRVVLTPRRWRQVLRRRVRLNRAGQNLNPRGDGGKTARSPGRSRSKPLKPLRAGMPGDFRCLRCEYSCAFLLHHAHTRLRVHWAPGIPHALRAEGSWHTSDASRREPAGAWEAPAECLKSIV
jgi:hypothetical protein